MTALIVIVALIAYLVVGAVYARSQAVRIWQRAYKNEKRTTSKTNYEDLAREWDERDRRLATEEMRDDLVVRALLWPFAAVFDLLRGPAAAWFTAPITERQQRAAQLRADAERWDQLRHTGTPAEQAMAAELADMCRQRAKEVDL